MPSPEPSPRPWRVNSVTGGHISDANGGPVCFCVGSNCGERAALIVAAVNERDRLRDIVRKTLRAIDALYTVAAPGAIVKELTPDTTCLDIPIGRIVAEARAAIGAGETPTGKGVGE